DASATRLRQATEPRSGAQDPARSFRVLGRLVDGSGLDDPILEARRMIGAAWLATGELDHSRHGDEQESASRRDQPQYRRALPHIRRRGTLRGNHIGAIDQEWQG